MGGGDEDEGGMTSARSLVTLGCRAQPPPAAAQSGTKVAARPFTLTHLRSSYSRMLA
jgi:hypothetical protein